MTAPRLSTRDYFVKTTKGLVVGKQRKVDAAATPAAKARAEKSLALAMSKALCTHPQIVTEPHFKLDRRRMTPLYCPTCKHRCVMAD